MSRKSAYKQVLSIGTAVVLGFALFTGSLDGAPKLLSPQSDEQATALAEKQNESPSRTEDEADLVARLESGTASSEDSQNSQDSGDDPDSAASEADDASADSVAAPIDEVENPDLNRARGVYLSSIPDYAGNPYVALRADSTHPLGTPSFTLDEYDRATEEGCFKKFSKLDSLGRTRKALACVGPSRSDRVSAAISRVSILPVGTSSATTLFQARASTTAATLSPGRSAAKTPIARISSPARAISTRRACCRLRSRFLTTSTTRATMCSTASRPCITKRNLSAVVCALRRNRSRSHGKTLCLSRVLLQPAAARADRLRHRPQPGIRRLVPTAPPVTQKRSVFLRPQGIK